MRRLEDTIRRHANRSRLWDSQSAFYIAGGYTKEGGGSGTGGRRPNHLELVARRVSEADAYLQLMIEQTNVSIVPRNAGIMQFIVIFLVLCPAQLLDKRIAELTDPAEQSKCKALQDNANVSKQRLHVSLGLSNYNLQVEFVTKVV